MPETRPLSIITGASTGIGCALTLELAQRGHDVIAIARRHALLDALRDQSPVRISTIAVDLIERSSPQRIVETLPRDAQVSCFIPCAGIAAPIAPLVDLSRDQLRSHFEINVEAPLQLTRELLPHLRGGRILFIGSDSATRPRPGWGAYCASKAAMSMLHACLRAELGPMGIAVGIAKPGAVDTDLLRAARDSDLEAFPDASEIRKLYERGAVASPERVARFLAHLLLEVETDAFVAREWDLRRDEPCI